MSRSVGVAEALAGLVPPWALPVVLLATMLAEAPVIAALILGRFWFRDRDAGLRLFAIATTALIAVLVAKHAFALPRPPAELRAPVSAIAPPFDVIYERLLDTDESGFPSGHTTLATAVFGGAAIDADDRRRWLAVAAVLVFVVGFSRVFLAVHFLADVAGGIVLGAGIVAAMRLADRWLGSPKGSLTLGVVAAGIGMSVVPGSGDVVAAAGTVFGAALIWLSVDLPSDPWPVSRTTAKYVANAVAIAVVAATPLLVFEATLVLRFVVVVVATSVAVAVVGFHPNAS
jgi:membrane-associated phospholipid phosphatase